MIVFSAFFGATKEGIQFHWMKPETLLYKVIENPANNNVVNGLQNRDYGV